MAPHLLTSTSFTCMNLSCSHLNNNAKPPSPNGWNSNPIAHQVVTMDSNYYIMTQCLQCDSRSGGCEKSMNFYDPIIMEQLEPGLAASFPAFLTHHSGIDKTLITLIRAGVAHCMSSSAWYKVFQELHVCQHDLQELNYLHAIMLEINRSHSLDQDSTQMYEPFSAFDDRGGWAGRSPSCWYINTIYQDYMEHI
jgi:hypothetical protein